MCEQRRRDRINEKMRALQELIPNCNKVMYSETPAPVTIQPSLIKFLSSVYLVYEVGSSYRDSSIGKSRFNRFVVIVSLSFGTPNLTRSFLFIFSYFFLLV